jgi:hypothetical protein
MKYLKTYIESINEYKLSTENYDKYYYLVLRFNENTLKNLISGKLKNLIGISDSTNIINGYFGIRDILLVMDKELVEKINDVEKVRYDDLDYLVNDNMKVLRRLYQVDDEYSVGSLLYQGIRKTEYFRHKKDPINNLNYLLKLYRRVNGQMYNLFKELDQRDIHKIHDIKFKNYQELLDKSLEILNKEKQKYSKENLDIMLQFIILSFASVFKDEGEILIKNETFNIPDSSFLFIKKTHPESYTFNNQNEILKKHIDRLKEKYTVKLLPYIKGDIISQSHKSVFSFIRYLDKLTK